MFTKKMAVAAALSLGVAAAGLSTSAIGQTPAKKEFVISVTATIPAIELEVKPVGELLSSQDVLLPWDKDSEKFKAYTGELTLKSNIGPITAALSELAVLTKDSEKIPLTITFNKVELNLDKKLVLEAKDANLQIPTALKVTIKPTSPDERKSAGEYKGTVTLVFEAGA